MQSRVDRSFAAGAAGAEFDCHGTVDAEGVCAFNRFNGVGIVELHIEFRTVVGNDRYLRACVQVVVTPVFDRLFVDRDCEIILIEVACVECNFMTLGSGAGGEETDDIGAMQFR